MVYCRIIMFFYFIGCILWLTRDIVDHIFISFIHIINDIICSNHWCNVW